MDQEILEKEFQPRPYQVELYEKAVDENCIIYLPTGTGKTYIAVLLVKRLSGAIQRPYHLDGKRTVFIVNTVALVIQQSAFLSRHTGLVCKGYTGDMHVDFWSKELWKEEIETNQVLIMTAQIFLNLLIQGIMPLDKVNLLIFDECHRAVGDHPMRQIMQRFEDYKENVRPRVLAMSASLLNCNVKMNKIESTLKELEITYHAKIITVDSLNIVSGFSTNPKEFLEKYDAPREFDVVKDITAIIENASNILDVIELPNKMPNESSSVFKPVSRTTKLKNILMDILEHNETGLYGISQAVLLHMIQLEFLKKFSDEPQLVSILDFLITQMMKIQKLLRHELGDSVTSETIYKFSSPKILKLIDVLKNFHLSLKENNNNSKFCCIIFVQRRFTAKVLYHILTKLNSCDPNFEFLKPEFMVGYNNDPYKNPREQLILSKWNKEALINFKNGVSNCIVATDVVDEGVDVPSCTLVVRYYAPMDFRAYIQSKGRARHSTSHYIVLAPTANEFELRYKTFQATEHHLRHTLHGKSDDRMKPSKDEVNNVLYKYTIDPYIVEKPDGTRSVITEQSAVMLINRYCASIYKSKFIMLSPRWIKEDIIIPGGMQYKVHLTLPVESSVIDTIVGDVMFSIDDAKRSAAVKACIKLYECGELDYNLLPRKPEDVLEDTKHLFPHMEEANEIDKTLGTTSKKRRHERIHPEALYRAFPKENEDLWLHIIEIKPVYQPHSDNRHMVFYNLLASNSTYGILSSKKMSEIPDFPIFMNVGELRVSIKVNNQSPSLTRKEINSIKVFHTLIFHHILNVIKEFMIFDNENLENSFLIVPVQEGNQINWDVINRHETIVSVPPPNPLVVKESDYKFALIAPTYRASNVYVVTEICEYLKAESSFPTPDFHSYLHYFKDKHDLQIKNASQPLLEVKPISKKINCIKPRSIKANLSKRKRANLTEDFEEHLVPELCERIEFPAVFWLKATVLPSILHRVTQLLTAQDLRVKIMQEANFNLKTLESGKKWDPLEIEERSIQSPDTSIDGEDVTLEEEDLDVDNLQIKDEPVEVDILSEEKSIYSWTREQEPPDLDRCIDKIQLIDIEYYYQFMSGATPEDAQNLKYQNALKSMYKSATKVPVPPLKMLKKTNPYGPSPIDILKSLTTKMCNDAFNFERVETLGDSFLKFAISLYLYQVYGNFGEGSLSFVKGKLVGNLNLFYCGRKKDIPGRINVEDFSPSCNFVVPAYAADRQLQKALLVSEVSANILYEMRVSPEEKLYGYISNTTSEKIRDIAISWPAEPSVHSGMEHFLGVQVVSDKSVSDCVEALIGTYLQHLGIEGALSILKWFEILPKTLDINTFLHSEVPDPTLSTGDINVLMPWADKIEEKIGYKFRNRAFLLQAFTHPSYITNRLTPSYQRLEFLGDAVLDFLLTVHIYETSGNLSPGELTDLRSALVNNITFACLAVRYGLHTALLAYVPKIFDVVDRFVKFQEDRNHEINDELLWVLMEEDECNMAEHVDVPKVLGDIYESLIGAIFLDSEKSLETVWNVIYCLMKKEIGLFSKNVPKQPIRVIHEKQGANPQFSKAISLDQTQTVMVTLAINANGKRKFFHGFGSTKKLAKCAASKQALKYLSYKR